MNDRSFKIVEKNVTERRQQLNAWAGAQVGGLITMSLTLAHLIGVFFGLMSLIQPWWLLIVANGAGLWIGSLAGRRRPIRLQQDLYRLDRSYDLGEKLATIHEIRQRDDRNPYLRLLYERISHTDLHAKRALQPSRRQRRGWAAFSGITVASAALLALWVVGVPPLSMSSLLASGTGGDQPIVSSQSSGPDAGNPQRESSANSSDAADTSEPQTGSPCDGDGGAPTEKLSRDARSDCANASSGEGSPSGKSQASSGNTMENERTSVAKLRRELRSIQQRMATGNLSMETAQRRLDQLAQEARSPSTEELLEQAAQSDSQKEMQQRMQDAMDELDRRRQRAQQGANGRDNSSGSNERRRRSSGNADGSRQGQAGGQQPASQEPTQSQDPQASQQENEGQPRSQEADGSQRSESGSGPNEGESGESGSSQQNGSQNESSQSGEQAGSQQGQQAQAESSQGENGQQASSSSQQGNSSSTGQSEGQSEGGGNSSESSESSKSSTSGNGDIEGGNGQNTKGQSQSQQNGSGQSGGSAPGSGSGDNQKGSSGSTDNEPANDLRIQSPNLPQDMETLKSMMTRGVPFDVSGSPSADGSQQLELNPDRVETLLRSRDLPPEVRDLVRSYFLSLAEGE